LQCGGDPELPVYKEYSILAGVAEGSSSNAVGEAAFGVIIKNPG
jgi:hypothetical protein